MNCWLCCAYARLPFWCVLGYTLAYIANKKRTVCGAITYSSSNICLPKTYCNSRAVITSNLSPASTAHFGCIEECVIALCAFELGNSTSCFLICCFTFSSVGSADSNAVSISCVATRIGNRQIQKFGQCDRLPSLPYRQGHFNRKKYKKSRRTPTDHYIKQPTDQRRNNNAKGKKDTKTR